MATFRIGTPTSKGPTSVGGRIMASLFYLVFAACLTRKRYFKLAGASIVYAGLLRIFPGLVVLGWLVVAGAYIWRHHRMAKHHVQMLLGGVAAAPSEFSSQVRNRRWHGDPRPGRLHAVPSISENSETPGRACPSSSGIGAAQRIVIGFRVASVRSTERVSPAAMRTSVAKAVPHDSETKPMS